MSRRKRLAGPYVQPETAPIHSLTFGFGSSNGPGSFQKRVKRIVSSFQAQSILAHVSFPPPSFNIYSGSSSESCIDEPGVFSLAVTQEVDEGTGIRVHIEPIKAKAKRYDNSVSYPC
jgi:hypothetical protein